MQVSDTTLVAMLQRRLRAARVFRLFVFKLGPKDVVYASALAWDPSGAIVEVKASAEDLGGALLMLLQNADTATAPATEEEP
jgi:hypothetical protein